MRVLLSTTLLCLTASLANAGTIALHQDANDPNSEGWADWRGVDQLTTGPVTGDVGGFDAWQIADTDGSDGGYQVALTGQQIDNATTNGWTLRARIRVVGDDEPINDSRITGVNFGGSGFILRLGSSGGDPVAGFLAGPEMTLTGEGNGYHLYEVIFDPSSGTSGTADLFVDGDEVISDFAGWNGNFLNGIVAIGSGGGGSTGTQNYNLVEFSIVPEPTSLILASVGVLPLGLIARRRSRR